MSEILEHKTESLTIEETASLKKNLNNLYLISIAIGILLIVFSLLLSFAFRNSYLFKYYFIIPLIIFTATTYITWIGTKKRRVEISNGLKEIGTYQIIEKKSYWDDDPGLGGMNMKYVLRSNFKTHFVEKLYYDQAQIGDYIIEHKAPLTRETLKIEIINKPAYNSVYNQLL